MNSPFWSRLAEIRDRHKTFYVCQGPHTNDAIYAENLLEYFRGNDIAAERILLNPKNPQRELLRCLDGSAIGVLGLNSQLDHAWIDSDNFLDLAAAAGVPVLHWILDHTSTRWREFTRATAQNSRFVFLSPFAEQYFRRYALPDSLTACTVNTGRSHRSRSTHLTRQSFLAREIHCLVPINLRRISGTIKDALCRRSRFDSKIVWAIDIAIEQAFFDLDRPLEQHLVAALADRGLILTNNLFNDAFQVVEDIVQIRRRQRIFEIARNFPVLIQSDESVRAIVAGGKARFEADVNMQTTLARMKSTRAVLNASRVNDEVHNRTENGLNAGCVNVTEDSVVSRTILIHDENALFYRYDDDSLHECLDRICSKPAEIYEIAEAGFALRDEEPFRSSGFNNLIELALQPAPVNITGLQDSRTPSLAL
jgi:hypothetical protein